MDMELAIIDINKDIGKVAARVEGLENKVEALEELMQATDVRRTANSERLNAKMDKFYDALVAHMKEETGFKYRIGTWLISSLGLTVLGLMGYIWKISMGVG